MTASALARAWVIAAELGNGGQDGLHYGGSKPGE